MSANDTNEDSRPLYTIIRKTKGTTDSERRLRERADTIFNYVKSTSFTQVVEWENAGSKHPNPAITKKMDHKDYIDTVIYPDLDCRFEISGPNGFRISNFLQALHKTINNFIREARKNNGYLPGMQPEVDEGHTTTPASTTVVPRVNRLPARIARPATRPKMSVRRIFEEDQKTEIERLTNAKLEGQERAHRDGKDLKARAEAVTELWTNCDNKEEYEKRAAEENAVREAELTPKQLSLNQSEFGRELSTVVASYFGKHGKQIGDAILFARYAFVDPKTNQIGFKKITVNGFSDEKFGGTTEEFEAWKTYAMHTLQPAVSPALTPQSSPPLLPPMQAVPPPPPPPVLPPPPPAPPVVPPPLPVPPVLPPPPLIFHAVPAGSTNNPARVVPIVGTTQPVPPLPPIQPELANPNGLLPPVINPLPLPPTSPSILSKTPNTTKVLKKRPREGEEITPRPPKKPKKAPTKAKAQPVAQAISPRKTRSRGPALVSTKPKKDPLLSWGVTLTKDGVSRKYSGREYANTFPAEFRERYPEEVQWLVWPDLE